VFTIVENEVGGWRLIDWRSRNLRSFVLRSAVDAEREGLHVEVEAADRAAIEQFEPPGCKHASNIDQLFGEQPTTNQLVVTMTGVQMEGPFRAHG
jgi:hypothetical protein